MKPIALLASLLLAFPMSAQAEDLRSWNDGPARQAIVDFVTAAGTEGGPGWIDPADRIAVFDNDGTLWGEQPLYFQALFIADRLRALAPEYPEWQDQPAIKAALDGDLAALAATGHKGLMELVAATHAGMTTEAFDQIVRDWLSTARHPQLDRPYNTVIYQPMVEMLDYLRANGFQTWIVSGGGIDFMRPWVEEAYGIPPQQVLGSQIAMEYKVVDGKPEILRLPEIFFVDDGPGKPVGIQRHIGKRPVLAVGNSDGDYEMLEYTTAGEGARLGVMVHHTDAEREVAYDRDSKIGRLDRGLTDAPAKGWVLIDMKSDWSVLYPDLP